MAFASNCMRRYDGKAAFASHRTWIRDVNSSTNLVPHPKEFPMNSREALASAIAQAEMVTDAYLGDLKDDDLLVRPTEGANHIAWQLGHLIAADNGMVNAVCPGSMPPLPEGFAEKHAKETAGSDDAAAFLTKDEYVKQMQAQRAGMKQALASLSDDDLGKPSPETMRWAGPHVASVISMLPVHWMMHAGQWAVVRRKLGRPPLF
jgi:DinB superfamily